MEQAAVRGELSRLPVFISFSKPKSKIVAEALRDWLPRVLQSVDPFISESIDKGTAWPEGLDEKLKAAKVGIFCLTSENLYQPWIYFEAGALYMNLGLQRVCPYLLDVDYSDVPWPLARFQSTKMTKAETRKLLATVNEALAEGGLKETVLHETFEMWWPRLEKSIEAARELGAESKPVKRGSDEILEEVVNLVRSQSRQIEGLEGEVSKFVAATYYGIMAILQPEVTSTAGSPISSSGVFVSGPARSGYTILNPLAANALLHAALNELRKIVEGSRSEKREPR